MMAKITKGKTFGGCVRYVLNEEKAYLLASSGVHESDPEQMINDFKLQALLNPKVKNVVGHISLNFPVEDSRMATDDGKMLEIAREYMDKMGIKNTQYIIARHTDKDHHHCHIVFNRVDNDGKTISDSNDRYRSEKVCKMLTAKHRLHFSEGKQNVQQENLKGEDAAKYKIYNAINQVLPVSRSWREFQDNLFERGIDTTFKFNGQTKQVQGVKFECDGYTLSGSKIDRQFSYGNLDAYFDSRMRQADTSTVSQKAQAPSVVEAVGEAAGQAIGAFVDIAGGVSGLFTPSTGDDYDESQAEAERKKRLKKKKPQQSRGRSM
jgi:hypothetical protein